MTCAFGAGVDNQAAVHGITSWSYRNLTMMNLLRCLFFIEAHYQFHLIATHIAGECNSLADDLSQNALPSFLSKALHMESNLTPILPQLPALRLAPSDIITLGHGSLVLSSPGSNELDTPDPQSWSETFSPFSPFSVHSPFPVSE